MPRPPPRNAPAPTPRACTMAQDKAVVLQTLARICLHLRELQTTPQSRRACEEIAAWLQEETQANPVPGRPTHRTPLEP